MYPPLQTTPMNDPLRPIRRSFREWRKSRRLEKEGDRYRGLFLERGLSVPGDEQLKALIKGRFPSRPARQKGELHILAIYHDYNWEGPSLAPSLAAFGEVRTLDWKDPALAGGKQPGDEGWRALM
ncbi:MAG: hypothetical protein ACE5GY_02380, partial [Thermodesulfobacteriota bacterium]